MPIEMQCAGCGQRIRVGDEHAGKKARCPACGTISQVPSGIDPTAPAPGVPSPATVDPAKTMQAKTMPAAGGTPFAAAHGGAANPYASPGVSSVGWRLKPHRGGLILTLGIAGLLCGCMPLGIVAWVMGATDLGQIKRGQMDPEGQTLTQVGMILGIVATAIGVLGTLFSILASFA